MKKTQSIFFWKWFLKFLALKIIGLCLVTSVVWAQSHTAVASIGVTIAEVYDSPAMTKNAKALLSRFTPVHILTQTKSAVKIRDAWGNMGWVKLTDVNRQERYVLANKPVTSILTSASQTATVSFEVIRDVALKVLQQSQGWLKVQHFSGKVGYVPRSAVIALP